MEHCILTLRKENDEKVFRAYVTDALKAIAENTARFAGGSYMQARFASIAGYGSGKKDAPEKVQTEEEIISRISGKLRAL